MRRLKFKNYRLSEKLFIFFMHIFLLLFGVICIFPFINVLARSLSPEFYIQQGQVWLWPIRLTLNAYVKIFQAMGIVSGFKNSTFVAIVGTSINLIMSFLIAYPLSRKRLPLRKTFIFIVVFTMLFPTGIIPMYLLVKKLGLMNSLWALIWPYAITTFNMIIIKNYFQAIPESLEESAFIDGAGELTILFKIFVPLSKPVISAIGLFYLIFNWNIFMPAVFFITHPSKYTIQVVLRDILTQHMLEDQLPFDQASLMSLAGPEAIQAAVTILAMIPILIIYPFIQKYFTRGMMIGSVKG
ncbi:MAG TPA: carbohydrate ABC transporter permease [Spirochaetales bacterium]|nr:carbohydrate ABC transporter permease [Spirochaetales bacterium]